MNNNLMNELDNIELAFNEFEDTDKIEMPNLEMPVEPNPHVQELREAQSALVRAMDQLKSHEQSPERIERIKKCENLSFELEEIEKIMEEYDFNISISEARTIREEKEKEIIEANAMEKPKMKLHTNQNVPSILPSENHKEHDSSFFRAFIYTAITCGTLMGAYITILF